MITAPWRMPAIADAFPYLRDRVYLDTAGCGLGWTGQGAAAAAFYDDAYSRGYDGSPLWRARAAECRQRVADLLGGEPSRVAFFRNTTEALNLVALGVSWRPGDEVVVHGDEFPSVRLPWDAAARDGATVTLLPPGPEEERTRRLVDAIHDGVRVVAVSHVHPTSGTVIDLDLVGAACHAVGALLVVDGIQAIGGTPLRNASADVYVAGVFKRLLSGFGLAAGSFSERARSTLTCAFTGYGNAAARESFEYAHVNYPGIYVLDAALRHFEELGWDAVHDRVSALSTRLATALRTAGWTVVTPEASRAGIVSFAVRDPTAVVAGLADRGIVVAEREGLVRVSPHFYNGPADIDRLMAALPSVGGAAN